MYTDGSLNLLLTDASGLTARQVATQAAAAGHHVEALSPTPKGPSYIDINPRLGEPGNAWRAGTDLVGAMIGVSLGVPPRRDEPGRPDVRTHQLLLAILGAAQTGAGRAGVLQITEHRRRQHVGRDRTRISG